MPPLPDAERLRARRRGKLQKLVPELSVAVVPVRQRSAREARWFARGALELVREREFGRMLAWDDASPTVLLPSPGNPGTLRGLARFVRPVRRGAADALNLEKHPELVTLPSEACAAADMPSKEPEARRRAALAKAKPRRYVAGPWVMKQLARWAYRRDAPLGHPGNR